MSGSAAERVRARERERDRDCWPKWERKRERGIEKLTQLSNAKPLSLSLSGSGRNGKKGIHVIYMIA